MFFAENELSIELLGVFKIKRASFKHKSFSNRAYDSISVRIDGNAEFETNEKNISVKKGDLLFIPSKANYVQTSSDETVIAIHFINYSNQNYDKIECLSLNDTKYTHDIFLEMYDIWKEKRQGYKHLCLSLFYKLLYFVNCTTSERKLTTITHETEISSAIEYIHRNYRHTNIKVSQLANMCAVSDTYFRKIFKNIYNVSPQKYIINLKLEFAYHLLGSNLYTVAEVSQKSGFSDPKYFCRVFKQHYNFPPKQLRLKDFPHILRTLPAPNKVNR